MPHITRTLFDDIDNIILAPPHSSVQTYSTIKWDSSEAQELCGTDFYHYSRSGIITLCAKLIGAVYCYRSCLFVCVLTVCLWVCYYDNSKLCAQI